jgi:Kdo2-lipid IVA lauroyltransferase/acyltransferase
VTRNGPSRNHEPARILQQFADKYEYSSRGALIFQQAGRDAAARQSWYPLFKAAILTGCLNSRKYYSHDRIRMALAYLLPRYWITWVGLGVMRAVELLPYGVQTQVGNAIGVLLKQLPLSYLRIARRNIALCLPELSAAERENLLDRHCRSLGVALCETANTWWSSDQRLNRLAEIQGLQHLEAALAKGRGAILVGGHFTTIEISTRILGTVVPLNVVYRPMKNALLSHIMFESFCRHGNPIPKDDIRGMVRALKRNEAVWFAPDQSYRNKGAAMVNFFGIPAASNPATSRLARISGAAVMTYFGERLPGNAGYRVVIGPAFENFPGPDPVDDLERYNRLLEAQVRLVPDQYLWVHRRFKGLSSDYPDYYGRDSRNPTSQRS